MPKRLAIHRLRSNRTYDARELAKVLGVSTGTIRTWSKAGLTALREQRPTLFLGSHVRNFLNDRLAGSKRPLGHDELYCFTCQKPRRPLLMMVDLTHQLGRTPRITGLCEVCEGSCHRMISTRAIPEFRKTFDFGTSAVFAA